MGFYDIFFKFWYIYMGKNEENIFWIIKCNKGYKINGQLMKKLFNLKIIINKKFYSFFVLKPY
jgi:hypothetical protein